jgi:Kef-type K+ transport system membrane component KefB
LFRFLNDRYELFQSQTLGILEFLAQLGLILLLFHVGLESKLAGLRRQLRRASVIWPGDVLFSGLLGFFTAFKILEFDLIPSLFIGTALTATSVGVSIKVWEEMNGLQSETGELLVDIAELDDISGVLLMALLFSLIPALRDGSGESLLTGIAVASGQLLLQVAVFGAFVILFALYAEKRFFQLLQRIESAPDPIITVAALGFIIAAFAGMMGLSLAIGAFFAGLIFSREPRSLKIDVPLNALYDFFSPFFFIGIGLHISLQALTTAALPGLILVAAAVLGKFFGDGIPASFTIGRSKSALLGASMIPRAEIAMIIMQRGLKLGPWAVSEKGFAAMVFVSLVTCIAGPFMVRRMFSRIQKENGQP